MLSFPFLHGATITQLMHDLCLEMFLCLVWAPDVFVARKLQTHIAMEVPRGGTGFIATASGTCQRHVLQLMGSCLVIALPRNSAPEGAMVQLVTDKTTHAVSVIKVPTDSVTPTCDSQAHTQLPFDAEAHKSTLLMAYLGLRDDVPATDSESRTQMANAPHLPSLKTLP